MLSGNTYQMIISAKDLASSAFDKVKNSIENLDKETKQSLETAGKWGAGVAVAVGALGVSVVKSASAFESSMSNVNTLLGDNQKHFKSLKKDVLDYAKTAVKPMQELTEATYDIVSAGIAQEDQLATLADSEKLAVAGLGTVKEATDLVTSSMNAFGVDSAKASNLVFEAVKNGKTTVAELSQGFGAVAGTAKEMGVKYEEFLAITSTGTTVGKKAAQVWTEQKAILTALNKPTAEMKELWEVLGVETGQELIETSGGLYGALQNLEEASDGNTETFAKAMSSAEGLGLAQQLLGESSESLKKTLGDMQNGVNSVDQAYEKQKKTMDALWQNLKNNFEVVMIKLGTIVLPAVVIVMEKLAIGATWLIEKFDTLSPTMQKTIVIGVALIGAFGVFLAVVGLVTFALSPLMAGLTGVGIVLGALISPLSLVVIAIGALFIAWQTNFLGIQDLTTATVWLFKKNWDDLQNKLAEWLVKFGEWWEGMKEMFELSGEIIKEVWSNMWQNVSDTAVGFVDGIKDAVQGMVDWITEKIDWALNKLSSAKQAVSDLYAGASNIIESSGVGQVIRNTLGVDSENMKANGGVFSGGFQAFANGGIVNQPTLGLIGEGSMNEAIVPLPDGKSIPVQMTGSSGRNISSNTSNTIINVNLGGLELANGQNIQTQVQEVVQDLVRELQLQKLGSIKA